MTHLQTNPMHDVTVIGGGPAGSSAALRLARNGLSVRLFEKSRFPRPKLCGGYLSPECLADLEDLGILPELKRAGVYPIRRTVIATRRGTVIETGLSSETFAVSRATMDDMLLRQAAREGVNVHAGQDGLAHARESAYTVMAIGRGSGPKDRYIGIQAFFQDTAGVSDQVELDLVESGYVGLARQPEGVNICALTTPEAATAHGPTLDHLLAHFIKENPILRGHLAGAKRTSAWLSVSPVRLGLRELVRDNQFFVGDAACVLDPFAGEGMAVGLYTSRLLAKAFQSPDPAKTYTRLWHQAFDSSIAWNAVMRLCYSLTLLREPIARTLRFYPVAMNWLNDLTRYRRLEGIG